jgi:AraC-like DNA-binding protein
MVLSRGENRLRPKYLYSLLPAFLVTICFSEYIFGNPIGLITENENYPVYEIAGFYIWLYNSPVFYVLTILALKKHQNNIKNHYSFCRSVDLKWLYYLSHGFALFILFILLKVTIQTIFDWEIPLDNYNISIGVVIVYIFGIGFFGYKQRGIFDNIELPEIGFKEENIEQIAKIKEKKLEVSYQKSGLNKEEALLILNKVKSLMQSEQPYLKSELDLPALAAMVGVSTHKLSQVINKYLNKNFFDFVNEYRIEKVKELLSDPRYNHFKIMSLAYESGFNTKSTFYNLFKKLENITPSEYRQKNQRRAG